MEHQLSKDWPKRHLASVEKWENIVWRMKAKFKIPFYLEHYITNPCGYCFEFGLDFSKRSCLECFLFNDNFCFYSKKPDVIFWDFVSEVKKENTDWDKALDLAEKMLARIKEDTPESVGSK